MKIRAERIITHSIDKGMFFHKVNDFNDGSHISINFNALIRMIEDNSEGYNDMDLIVMINYHYGKFTDEQLDRVLNRVRYIINHNDKYKEYRYAKEIVLV